MGPKWDIHEAAHGGIVLGGEKLEALGAPITGEQRGHMWCVHLVEDSAAVRSDGLECI